MSTSSVGGEGLFSETTPSESQPVPGILTMYPGCTPRPRDRRAYDAACAAANGQHVIELNACQIERGMRAWCGASFLAVTDAIGLTVGQIPDLATLGEEARRHPFVLIHLDGSAATGCIIGELDTPVYVLA
ncbi:MAG: hypothetical protein HOW97_32970 [Catenulispora sp.]|nr:hypothetical protein [Catenulispora sp.]